MNKDRRSWVTPRDGDLFMYEVHMEELRQVTQLVVNQVSHWTPARWGSRGDTLHQVLQRIAGPEHVVPRLSDVALADQLRVLVADLMESTPDQARLSEAIEALRELRASLTAQ
jgi:hypothetical protein